MQIGTKHFLSWIGAALILILPAGISPANERELPSTFQRILFLGNSITRHGPKEDIGWSGNWGMAASSGKKDFVHLVTGALSRAAEKPCKTMVRSMAGFERNYAAFDLQPLIKEAREFDPDLVIVAIGENVPKLDSGDARKTFGDRTRKLLQSLQSDDGPVIVVRSCFWANEAKDEVLRSVCGDIGGTFVDIGQLGDDESNYARSERDFAHKGVAAHPGDRGMRAIADAILSALEK